MGTRVHEVFDVAVRAFDRRDGGRHNIQPAFARAVHHTVQRARAQLIALRQQQEGGLVEVREGLHGAVILEEAVRGDFLPAEPLRDGILWHMGARNGQKQMVGTYGLTREPLFLDRRAAEIDVGLSVQQPLVDAGEYIALLQDAVDPENTIEEEALLLADGRSFGFCYP